VLFGHQMPGGYFNDDNVGRVLDHLFNVGTQKIFSALSVSALQRFELSTDHVHGHKGKSCPSGSVYHPVAGDLQ
jgi:hypothetical protein